MKQDKTAILIKKAALEFDKISNAVLDEYDLTTSQFKIMKYLYEEADNGVRIVDLERYYSISHPTAIGVVQNLEKKEMIEYRENPNNARSRFIIPSKKAYDMRDKLDSIGDMLDLELTKNLNDDEKEEINVLLKKIIGIEE